LACTCSPFHQLFASSAFDDVWRHLLVTDFGARALQMPESMAAIGARCTSGYGAARAAHRSVSELRRSFSHSVTIVQGDICEVPRQHSVDAIVCPAVPNCGPYGPCARAVHHIAGDELWEHIQDVLLRPIGGRLGVGQALVSPAFDFPDIRAIVHVVGPTREYANKRELLHDAYCTALKALEEFPGGPLRRAAIASISTGGNGIAEREAAPIAMAAIRDAIRRGCFEQVYIVAWDEYTRSVFDEARQAVLDNFSEDPAVPDIDPDDLGWD